MYTRRNYKTKKELKADVAAWNEYVANGKPTGDRLNRPQPVTYFQPNKVYPGPEPRDGTIYCEGPHYPQAHKWYAECEVKDGFIIKVK